MLPGTQRKLGLRVGMCFFLLRSNYSGFFQDVTDCCCGGQAGVGCSEGCRCEGCMNKYGKKEGLCFDTDCYFLYSGGLFITVLKSPLNQYLK